MKQNLKFAAFFVIFTGGIPVIAVYFGQIFGQVMEILSQLTL